MKPISIEMTNIGPFVKRTFIDLETIDEGGLFLISGPTGSGKSIIFDAICYALYGKTPSGRERNLRSDHAPSGEEPIIRFRFQVGNEFFLIERVLEYEASKRGGGFTTRPEKASMIRYIPDPISGRMSGEVVLASQKSEVKNRAVEVLGLDMEQFSRVMMIPQGEFRELLRADTDKREVLLRNLFGSELYRDVSESIEQRSKRLYIGIKDERTRTDQVIDSVAQKLSIESKPGDGITFDEWSQGTLKDLNERLGLSRSEELEKKTRWEKDHAAFETAKGIFGISTELRQALEKMANLDRIEKDEMIGIMKILERNRKAQRIRPSMEKMDHYIEERGKMELEVTELNARYETKKKTLDEKRKRFEEVMPLRQKELDAKRTRISNLEAISPKVVEISGLGKELKERTVELEGLETKQKLLREGKLEKERAIRSITIEIEKLPEKEDIVYLSSISSAGSHLVRIMEEQLNIEKEIRNMRSKKKELEDCTQARESSLNDLRKRREDSIASELARTLEEGMKCPVCGSEHHPSPRQPTEEDVTLEKVTRASEELEKVRTELDDARNDLTKLETSLNERMERKKEITEIYQELVGMEQKELKQVVKEFERRRTAVEQRDKEETRLIGTREGLVEELRVISLEEEKLNDSISGSKIDIKGISSVLAERASTLKGFDIELKVDDPASFLQRSLADLEKGWSALKNEMDENKRELDELNEGAISLFENLKAKRGELESIEKRIRETTADILSRIEKLDTDGLRNIKELRESLLEEDRERDLTGIVDKFNEDKISVKSSIGTLKKRMKEMGEGVRVPTEEEISMMEEKERTSRSEWQQMTENRANLESDLKWTQKQIRTVEDIARKIEEMERTLRVVGRLSREVKGLSNPRMSLERFFLAQRFEEVLMSSNHRLKILSGGRFLLRRADEMEMGKKAKVGLDLNVYDNYTGQERPANTLSGGQMFLCSLALALGLADVVQSRSGGIRMDALFIDEGFGSLDEETLQTALKVLSELREGRMVGVISHVGELKRQIRCGFEVIPSPSGSSVRSIQ
ncbi:MAG: AAA family ATPase [Candidatus Thermoplasmatota archaeon]|nr:AAA family ATPase [Candidatus Thermoplasmatota archaeon]